MALFRCLQLNSTQWQTTKCTVSESITVLQHKTVILCAGLISAGLMKQFMGSIELEEGIGCGDLVLHFVLLLPQKTGCVFNSVLYVKYWENVSSGAFQINKTTVVLAVYTLLLSADIEIMFVLRVSFFPLSLLSSQNSDVFWIQYEKKC